MFTLRTLFKARDQQKEVRYEAFLPFGQIFATQKRNFRKMLCFIEHFELSK